MPKIFKALEKPNNSTVLYPNLILLLSQLPLANYQEGLSVAEEQQVISFYNNFFASFRKGAEKELGFLRQKTSAGNSNPPRNVNYGKHGVHANSTLKSCINAYFECILYGVQHAYAITDTECKEDPGDIQIETPAALDVFCTQVINQSKLLSRSIKRI